MFTKLENKRYLCPPPPPCEGQGWARITYFPLVFSKDLYSTFVCDRFLIKEKLKSHTSRLIS